MDRSTGDVATTLMRALAGYDAETLGDLLAPDATRWLNLTEEETSRDDLLDLMRLEREHVRSSQFTERCALDHRAAVSCCSSTATA